MNERIANDLSVMNKQYFSFSRLQSKTMVHYRGLEVRKLQIKRSKVERDVAEGPSLPLLLYFVWFQIEIMTPTGEDDPMKCVTLNIAVLKIRAELRLKLK